MTPRAILATTVPVTLRAFHTGTVRALKERGFDVTVVSSPGADLDQVAAETGSPAVSLRMSRGLTPLADARAFFLWVVTVRQVRPSLIIAGTPKCALLAMTSAALLRVKRRVYVCGGLRFEGETGWRRMVLVAMERLAMQSATEVVVNSRSLLEEVSAAGLVSAHKVRQTEPGSSHGVDAQHFSPRPFDAELARSVGLEPHIPIVGFVGRLTHDKGIDTLIEAMRVLGESGTPAQLLVVGPQDEPDSQLYVERLKDSGVPAVSVGGRDDVRPFFSLMSVHVLPSLREGFPNVVLEAAAMGVPSVTTTATGCRDAVLDGETGRLFSTGNVAQLVSVTAALLKDADERERLGRNARHWVTTEFVPKRIAAQIVDVPSAAPLTVAGP